MAFLGGVFFAY